jgi:hypothetical protein
MSPASASISLERERPLESRENVVASKFYAPPAAFSGALQASPPISRLWRHCLHQFASGAEAVSSALRREAPKSVAAHSFLCVCACPAKFIDASEWSMRRRHSPPLGSHPPLSGSFGVAFGRLFDVAQTRAHLSGSARRLCRSIWMSLAVPFHQSQSLDWTVVGGRRVRNRTSGSFQRRHFSR